MDIHIVAPLVVAKLGNQCWRVEKDFIVFVGFTKITVPAGFITDGASAPRLFWSICAPMTGPFGEAGVVHDFLYATKGPNFSRVYADEVLRNIGLYRGASTVQARLVWLGVRVAGDKYFKAPKVYEFKKESI